MFRNVTDVVAPIAAVNNYLLPLWIASSERGFCASEAVLPGEGRRRTRDGRAGSIEVTGESQHAGTLVIATEPHSPVEMRIMCLRAAGLVWATVLALGCSDGSGPTPPTAGRFQAHLSGALNTTLSGTSNVGAFATEDFPDGRFAIRMYAPQADTLRSVNIDCPGLARPETGSYAIASGMEGCRGAYGRLFSSVSAGTIVLEHLSASSGQVVITVSTDGQLAGTFRFDGILVADPDTVGPVTASGAFNAVLE